MNIKSRHHLRSDEIDRLETTLDEGFGIALDAERYERVVFVDAPFEVVLIDGDPAVFAIDDRFAPTVRGANDFPPEKRVVTVDTGAISFVSDGANVMRPGVVEADSGIEPGDLVVIIEETHGKALAIGEAVVPGDEIPGESGMVIESIHHVGDDLYEFHP